MKPNTDHPLVILSKALPIRVVVTLIAQIAVLVGLTIFGAVMLGIVLDRELGTKPLLTLALGIASLPVAVWLTYKVAVRASLQARREYEAYLATKNAPVEVEAPPQTQPVAAPASGAKILQS